MIRAIALLHQYQREVKSVNHNGQVLRYIEVIPQDIETANKLAHDVLGRSLDELPPQTRTLLKHIHAMVTDACQQQGIQQSHYRFNRKELRDYSGWGDFQVRTHLSRLVEMEYVLTHRGGRGQSFIYELLYDGQGLEGQPFLSGLIKTETLKHGYDEKLEGVNDNNEGSLSTQRAPVDGPSSTPKKAAKPSATTVCPERDEEPLKSASIHESNATSYRSDSPSLVALPVEV